jgi:hypothetical protein
MGKEINKERPAAMQVVRAIIASGARAARRVAPDADWARNTCTWARFQAGLRRTEPKKGVGCDGWNAYLLRKAPEPVQRRYYELLLSMIRTRQFPEEWRERVAMLFMKPGEDPCELGRRRDIWLECHGHKLTMWMLGAEYERAAAETVPLSQSGATTERGCPEQTLVMRCQKEQCAAEQTMCCRVYLDLGVFYMSCVREIQWETERWCGVRPEVTETVQALYKGMCGRYETAHGLTEKFPIENGNMQGCSQSPCRSKMHLRLLQDAVGRLCEGFRFRGATASTPTLFFVDDGAFLCKDLHTMQMVIDTCWMVTRAAGLKIQIKKDKKTAWQASYWENGVEKEVTDWEITLPDGRPVPRVAKEYTYLGSAEPATWEHAQEGVRRHVVSTCSQLLRMIGRAGALGEQQLRVAMSLAVEGTISFYGRATAIGWDACEEIERVRREVLRQRGFASGDIKLQVHASRDAGGLEHRHAYQHATAALVDEIERALDGEDGTPARTALEAHMRATCVRLGWHGRDDVRTWHPTHLEHVLSEEMIGEAWLLAKLRTGTHSHAATSLQPPAEEGPPIWEADPRPEWRAKEHGPCRVRVGLAKTGGATMRVTAAGRGCEFTMRTRRIAAAGVRTWSDITHEDGRWMTWPEMRRRYESLRDTDRGAYDAIVDELNEDRWSGVRTRWWAQTQGDGWSEWATARAEAGHGAAHGDVKRITAARRTAKSLGEWEALVEWHGGWTPSWERVAQLQSGRKGLTAGQRAALERCKQAPVPSSLYERITEDDGNGKRRWAHARAGNGRAHAKAHEVQRAVEGELSDAHTEASLLALWRVFEAHVKEVRGNEVVRGNADDTPRPRARRTHSARARTLYAGRDEMRATESGGAQERVRMAGLATDAETDDDAAMTHVTPGRVAERIRLQRYLDRRDGELPVEERERVMPKSRPHERMHTENDAANVWRDVSNAGYEMIEEEDVRADPVMRLFARHSGFEWGLAHVTTADGQRVQLDEEERKVLGTHSGGDTAAANARRARKTNARVSGTACGLHIEHDFTDAWATDGSKARVWADGAWRTRVACGATQGAMPTEAEWYESADATATRALSAGMIGMRLPSCYEVLDAELHAILLALQHTATQGDGRRCLIMSDSLTALEMVEDAWRHGVRWRGAHASRAAMLHAINTVRARIEIAVMMWTPAHAGVTPNATADAIAKTYLMAPLDDVRTTAMVTAHLPAGRTVQLVDTAEGRVLWPAARYEAVREATGWWVRRREQNERAQRAVDGRRIGQPWAARRPAVCEAVWERTGAYTAAPPQETETGTSPQEQRGDHATLLAAAEADARDNGKKSKRKKTPKATGADAASDRERCGVAMAARAGALWEGGTSGVQGCPACCSRARGWAWTAQDSGRWAWRSAAGGEPRHAHLLHVVCGECSGVADEDRSRGKEEIRQALQTALRAATRRRRGTHVLADGRASLVDAIQRAQRALAKGSARASEEENAALTAWLAGKLPHVEGHETKRVRSVVRQVTDAVRHAQRGAATLRAAWRDAGKEEMARRATRDGGREGTKWRGVGWEAWRQTVNVLRAAEAEPEGEPKGEQRHGWTMAAALIWYKQRQMQQQQQRRAAPAGGQADPHGNGVVVFDVETTHLIEDDVPMQDMDVSVATAVWLPRAKDAAAAREDATTQTFWHETVRRSPDGNVAQHTTDLLKWFDRASVIVAYNGREFDMQVLRRAYAGDDARWRAHCAKMMDPMDAVRRATGRRVALSKVLELNGAGHKVGVGSDAPRWWQEGRLAQLERYCEQDTNALTELVTRAVLRLPGLATTREASVLAHVLQRAGDTGDDATETQQQPQEQQQPQQQRQQQQQPQPQQPQHSAAAGGQKRGRGGSDTQPTQHTDDADGDATTSQQQPQEQQQRQRQRQRQQPQQQQQQQQQHSAAAHGQKRGRADSDAQPAHATRRARAARAAGSSNDTAIELEPELHSREIAAPPPDHAAPQPSAADGAGGSGIQNIQLEVDSDEDDGDAGDDRRDGIGRPPTSSTAELAETSNLPGRASRGKRKVTYDETRRQTKPRRPPGGPRPVYLERGNGRGAKRTAIVLGPAAIERIVGGRYEWRDAGFKRPRHAGR